MEDPIVSDVVIENRAGVGSVFHDDSMFGTGKKDDPLGVNREQFLPQNGVLFFHDIGWGVNTLNMVARWASGAGTYLCGMTYMDALGRYAGQFLSTSYNIDPNTGKIYNTFDVCAMNAQGRASGFVCRMEDGETEGTVELYAPKELSIDDDSNYVASTHWVQTVLLGNGYMKAPQFGQDWQVLTWYSGGLSLQSPISRYFSLESWGSEDCWFSLYQTEPTTTRFTIYAIQNGSVEYYAAEIYMFDRDLSVIWQEEAPKTFDVEIFYDDGGYPVVHVSPKDGVVMERILMTGVRSGFPFNGDSQWVENNYEPRGDVVMAKVLTASKSEVDGVKSEVDEVKAEVDEVKAQIGDISTILDYINGEAI